ncbi:MAG: hypothetical protein R3B37_17935 [Nitrospira sp.]|nr:hypothetical protein [Nitrospira sp.]
MNSANELTADAGFTSQYDDNENRTCKTLLATVTISSTPSDAEKRLMMVKTDGSPHQPAVTRWSRSLGPF